MNAVVNPKPSLFLRIAQFPLTRLLVLGGVLFLMMGVSNGFRAKYASAPLSTIVAAVGMTALAFAVYFAFARFIEKRAVNELSLHNLVRELGFGLLIGAGLYTACVLILMALGYYRIDGLNPWHFMVPAVAMALSSGIFEELFFRGVVFRVFEETLGSWIALIASSLIFGASHLANPAGTLLGAVFISVEAGILLAAAYMVTRRLWMSMGFHMAWNYTQSGVFSGIVSGGDTEPGLIRATIKGSDLLTGGSFGLEASVIAFALCTATGIVLLVMAVRGGKIVPPIWKAKN